MEAATGGRTLTSKYWHTFIPKKKGSLRSKESKLLWTYRDMYLTNCISEHRESTIHHHNAQKSDDKLFCLKNIYLRGPTNTEDAVELKYDLS